MSGKKMKTCSCGKIIPESETCSCKKDARREYQKQYQRNDKNNPLKTARWTNLRKEIIKRDGGLCQRCLRKYGKANAEDLQGHHIKSRRDYPELVFTRSNIITLCRTCNLQLGTSNKLDFEFRTTPEEKDFNIF